MYYTVYKTVNTYDNKVYVGVHSTDDLNDGYIGSSLELKADFREYGKDVFTTSIVYFCKNQDEAYSLEELIVDSDFVNSPLTYNKAVGGKTPNKSLEEESPLKTLQDTEEHIKDCLMVHKKKESSFGEKEAVTKAEDLETFYCLTGDIVGSTSVGLDLDEVYKAFPELEFFRGDSFQAVVEERPLLECLKIRAKFVSLFNVDVRVGIGKGKEENYKRHSGEALDTIGKNRIKILSDYGTHLVEPLIPLVDKIVSRWTPLVAEIALDYLERPDETQIERAIRLNIPQSRISERLSKSSIKEIIEAFSIYPYNLV